MATPVYIQYPGDEIVFAIDSKGVPLGGGPGAGYGGDPKRVEAAAEAQRKIQEAASKPDGTRKGVVVQLLTDGIVGGTAFKTLLWAQEDARYLVKLEDGETTEVCASSIVEVIPSIRGG